MAATKEVSIRISLDGKAQITNDLRDVGNAGQNAGKQIANGFQAAGAAADAQQSKFKAFTTAFLSPSGSQGLKAYTSALDEVRGSAGQLVSSLGPLGGILKGVGGAYLLAGAGVAGFIALLKEAATAGDAEQQNQLRIAAVLRATGDASGQTADSINQTIGALASGTLQTKDALEQASAVLLTFRDIGPDAFGRTLALASDMSTVFGGDLSDNVRKLGIVLEDPISGMNRLRQTGLALSASQKEVIEQLQRTGDLAGAQRAFLDDLAGSIGGSAQSQHAGLAGATHDLSVEWSDFLIQLDNTTHASGIASTGIDAITKSLKGLHDIDTGAGNILSQIFSGPNAGSLFVQNIPTPNVSQVRATPEAAWTGPLHQAAANQNDLVQGLNTSIAQLMADAAVVGERQRAINDKLEAIAKANNTAVETIQKTLPAEYQKLVAAAGADYDAQHPPENISVTPESPYIKQLEEEQKQAQEAQKYVAGLTLTEVQSANSRKQAEDAYQADVLEGRVGYYDALRKQSDDALSDQYAAIQAETDKELAALQEAIPRYGLTQQQIEDARTLIAQSGADKRAAADAQASQRSFDIARQQLEPYKREVEGTFDSVASDFTNFIAQGKYDWKDFGDAAKSAIQDIVSELLKLGATNPLKNLLFGENNPTLGGLGGVLGGVFGGQAPPLVLPTIPVLNFHRGGTVGQGGDVRSVYSSILDGAPRFHSGMDLSGDEVPAILKKGERVLNPSETRAYNSGSGAGANVTVNVTFNGNADADVTHATVTSAVTQALTEYDKTMPGKIYHYAKQVKKDPRLS